MFYATQKQYIFKRQPLKRGHFEEQVSLFLAGGGGESKSLKSRRIGEFPKFCFHENQLEVNMAFPCLTPDLGITGLGNHALCTHRKLKFGWSCGKFFLGHKSVFQS